ncbi:hypothetical protein KP509_18G041300 [Ceratopteris richardii]|uniref:Uncharacterized protein n=1 Tax=Ceratopteris richardii TaxID=49495 RepID=A0A8T2SST5_CERRI|nr:hypothetical protein KP509_18G041300 [Ceratopteris richardii]KAH7365700.1 hypothetical protein KP509_18G041300 [Ceratopteris richardii]KAH7365701.1 hypothetical protein KP509_18G041300 [Ceratopteris richardii]
MKSNFVLRMQQSNNPHQHHPWNTLYKDLQFEPLTDVVKLTLSSITFIMVGILENFYVLRARGEEMNHSFIRVIVHMRYFDCNLGTFGKLKCRKINHLGIGLSPMFNKELRDEFPSI